MPLPQPEWVIAPGLTPYAEAVAAMESHVAEMAAGRAGSTPVAVVENGSRPDERVLTGRLDGLGALVRQSHLTGPTLLFVGETAAFSARSDVRAEAAA